jgi:hypothetical protein
MNFQPTSKWHNVHAILPKNRTLIEKINIQLKKNIRERWKWNSRRSRFSEINLLKVLLKILNPKKNYDRFKKGN